MYNKTTNLLTKRDALITPLLNKSSKNIEAALADFLDPSIARRTTNEMAAMVKAGVPPPKVLARVVIDGEITKFATISRLRPTLFVFDPAEIRGLSKGEVLAKIGYTQEGINKAMRSSISVSFLEIDPSKFIVEVPTWKSLKNFAVTDKDFMRSVQQSGIDSNKIGSLLDEISGIGHQKGLSDDAERLQGMLQDRYGTNTLFSGDGLTRTSDNAHGVREWWIRPTSLDGGEWNHAAFSSISTLKLWK